MRWRTSLGRPAETSRRQFNLVSTSSLQFSSCSSRLKASENFVRNYQFSDLVNESMSTRKYIKITAKPEEVKKPHRRRR